MAGLQLWKASGIARSEKKIDHLLTTLLKPFNDILNFTTQPLPKLCANRQQGQPKEIEQRIINFTFFKRREKICKNMILPRSQLDHKSLSLSRADRSIANTFSCT